MIYNFNYSAPTPISRAQRNQSYNVVYSATTKSFATRLKRVNCVEIHLGKKNESVESVIEKTAKLCTTGRFNLSGQNVQFPVEQKASSIETCFVSM